MAKMDELRRALCDLEVPSRRELRAAQTRAQVLAPGRILLSLLTLPFLALAVAASIYIRTSDYDPPQAMLHLVARISCDAALSVGLAPAYRGGLGYHARNDADGDGVACETFGPDAGKVQDVAFSDPVSKLDTAARMVGGAKFVRPQN